MASHLRTARHFTYPASDWFVEAFGADALEDWLGLIQRIEPDRPMSLALCLPPDMHDDSLADAWLRALDVEAALYGRRGVAQRQVGEMHWSGGVAQLSAQRFEQLRAILAARFHFAPHLRLTVALAPLSAALHILPLLAASGVTAVDIGFDLYGSVPAHGRHVPAGPDTMPGWRARVAELVAAMRGVASHVSIGLALHCGPAGQISDELEQALEEVLAQAPDRIIVLHDADTQRELRARQASPALIRTRLPALRAIAQQLTAAGYVRIACDYYALPNDPSAIAQRRGWLALRPFGPSVHPGSVTLALGPGATGSLGPVYYQNQTGDSYLAALALAHLPVMRGFHLSNDDLARRSVIHSLAINLFLDPRAIEAAHGIDFGSYFEAELVELSALERGGLLSRSADAIELTSDGLLVATDVSAVFDAYLKKWPTPRMLPI